MKNTKLAGILISSIIFILACGAGGTAIPNASLTPEISIQITGTSVVEIASDSISQPNCNGTAEVENQIEKSRTIAHTLETSGEFTVNANGQIGFAGTDVELGATVAAKLGTTYGLTETIAKSLTVKARPGTNMTHTIKQSEVWKVGTAKISVGNQEVTIPFQFRDDFTIELVSSEDQGCGSQNPAPSASLVPPVNTPLPPTETATVTKDYYDQGEYAPLIEDVTMRLLEDFATPNYGDYWENKPSFAIRLDVISAGGQQFIARFDPTNFYAKDDVGTNYPLVEVVPNSGFASHLVGIQNIVSNGESLYIRFHGNFPLTAHYLIITVGPFNGKILVFHKSL